LLEHGDPSAAATACELGLARDRQHDALWRLLIAAREQAGDLALAVHARREYERMLGALDRAPARHGAVRPISPS
ncbi:MAG TPA: hypothetical protein VGF46_10140, partial [Gaiellales bacterium]